MRESKSQNTLKVVELKKYLPLFGFLTVLFLSFIPFVMGTINLSLSSELYSHMVMVPFISLFFVWQERMNISVTTRYSGKTYAFSLILIFLIGLVCINWSGIQLKPNDVDKLALGMCFFIFLLWVFLYLYLGDSNFKKIRFEILFLVLLIPFPTWFESYLEAFLQEATADTCHLFFKAVNATFYRADLTFILPNISISIAPQCSGIRSSFVLVITSIIAAHMFLKTTMLKLLLVIVSLIIGIFRNGFRIFILGMGSSSINPELINSGLHTQGGPLFFLLSLVPLFAILIMFKNIENKKIGERYEKESLSC